MPVIDYKSFETRSTTTNDHYIFYLDITKLRIYLIMQIPTVTWSSSSLFQQIKYLIIQMPTIDLSLWNNLLNMGKKNKSFLHDSIKIILILLF